MEEEFKNVSIPASLYRRIEELIKGTAIASVDDYVVRFLREKLTQEKSADVFSPEDEEKIKERLKALGYLD